MYKIYVLFLIFFFVCFAIVGASEKSLNGKIIYIDPGHGGVDPGATYKDIYEDVINLEFSKVLKEELEKVGAKVYMTRYGDYDLSSTTYHRKGSDLGNRAVMINNSDCDLYLSIHLNSSVHSSWNGAQVFYDDINEKNGELAKSIQIELNDKQVVLNNEYYMYSRIKKPGVLIELGFISNSNDRNNLQNNEYQKKISAKIIEGVSNFFNNIK